jgi:hypothetical protein
MPIIIEVLLSTPNEWHISRTILAQLMRYIRQSLCSRYLDVWLNLCARSFLSAVKDQRRDRALEQEKPLSLSEMPEAHRRERELLILEGTFRDYFEELKALIVAVQSTA